MNIKYKMCFILLLHIAAQSFAQSEGAPPPSGATVSNPPVYSGARVDNQAPSCYCDVRNGTFSTLTGCGATTNLSVTEGLHFNTGCVNGWSSSHGSPEIKSASGEQFAMMWTGRWYGSTSYPIRGEGIFTKTCFEPGKKYSLSFKLQTSTNGYGLDEVNVYLSNNFTANTSGSQTVGNDNSFEIPQVTNKFPILELRGYENDRASKPWETFSIDFVPNDYYNTLWIYPKSQANYWFALYIDDVQLNYCGPISRTYTLTSNLPKVVKVQDYIAAGTAVTVEAGDDVTFKAGNEIRLLAPPPGSMISNGFSALAGSNFRAMISPCGVTSSSSCLGGRISFDEKQPGVEEVETSIAVHPNPSNGSFRIKAPTIQDAEIRLAVADVRGKEVYRIKLNNNRDGLDYNLDLRGKPKGVYIIRIATQKGVYNRKVIINHD